ncbi:MAG TPA: MBL fold metallo-hydrolase [Candidatus Krumholzibacteria bacterium]|nr:MBL fold metallo-hydrolase [Candidatus Krumholzibacteria bacterium]HRX51618.1 MBL fold metallo-hydrolase [Candidatus Krumholzibacteria bacterium]
MPLLPRGRAVLLLAALLAWGAIAYADVTIHCLYVGQADATLIQSSSGRTMLFDGGNNGDGDAIILPYMAAAGIDSLSYVLVSHYHSDHCGGVDDVLDALGPISGGVWDRGWSYTTATYSSYAASAAGQRHTAAAGQVFDLGDGVTVTVVAVNTNGLEPSPFTDSAEENAYCLALHVEAGDFDFFVAGDLTGGGSSEADVESLIGAQVGDVEVYRVNHHGSYTSSNAAFLDAISAEVGVISCPVSSSYGHPHQDPLDRMAARGMYLYQMAQGSTSTYPAGQRVILNTLPEESAGVTHVVIQTDGSAEYTVNGDVWLMDENPALAAPPAPMLAVLGNYPNPFNPITDIRFTTSRGGVVRITVVDLAGRRLQDAVLDAMPGLNVWRWDGQDAAGRAAASGVYLYRVQGRDGAGSGKMVLSR